MMISYVCVFLVLLESVVISIVAKNQESFFGVASETTIFLLLKDVELSCVCY